MKLSSMACSAIFQSTHPARGGTAEGHLTAADAKISIHPPREGWDLDTPSTAPFVPLISIHPPREGWDPLTDVTTFCAALISIHPPREGWDRMLFHSSTTRMKFQSTHPARGGTRTGSWVVEYAGISIHPPREGWDVVAGEHW